MKKEERPWLSPEQQVAPPTEGWEGFRYWLKNVYWYHYRVATFVVLIALGFVIFFIRDMVTKVEPDFVYTVITPDFVSQEVLTECTALVGDTVGDLNEDGQVDIECSALSLQENTELGMASRMKMVIDFQREEVSLFIMDEDTLDQVLGSDFASDLADFNVGLEGKHVRVDQTPVFVRAGLTERPLYALVRLPRGDKDQRPQQEWAARIIRALLDAQ